MQKFADHEICDDELLGKWIQQEQLYSFTEEMFLFVLATLKVKKNITIDLSLLIHEYVEGLEFIGKTEFPEEFQEKVLVVNEKANRKSKKELIKTFKKLKRLGFIEVIESFSWRKHLVNIVPVWEQEKK